MKVRIVIKLDGSISIIHPAPNSWRKKDKLKIISEFDEKNKVFKNKSILVAKAETEEDWLDRVFSKTTKELRLEGRPYKDVDESEIPKDRSFRNAWEFDNITKKIKINAVKKKEIEDRIKIDKRKEEIKKENEAKLEKQIKEELEIND